MKCDECGKSCLDWHDAWRGELERRLSRYCGTWTENAIKAALTVVGKFCNNLEKRIEELESQLRTR